MRFHEKLRKTIGAGVLSLLISFIADKHVLYLMVLWQSASIVEFFSYVTLLGETLSIIFIGIVMSIFIIREKRRLLPLWATIFTVFVVMFVMKSLIDRPRPFEFMQVASIVNTSLSSFPSGHAMAVFSLVPFALILWPKYSYGFWTVATLIAFSRVYLQVHYLSDIVAGAFIGYAVAVIYTHLGDTHGWK
jgi:undecaprenyl-diphosphatase